jgi:hypothetical protein
VGEAQLLAYDGAGVKPERKWWEVSGGSWVDGMIAVEFEWRGSYDHPTYFEIEIQLPRKVTAMSNIDYEEDDAQAYAINYSLDIGTQNRKLSAEQRAVVREMMQAMVAETTIKLMMLGLSDVSTVAAHISTSNSGRRVLEPEAVETTDAP